MTRWQDAHGPTWNGLAPGQSWAIPADGPWQARLDRMGRAHVVGRALAEHEGHGPGYLDPKRVLASGGFMLQSNPAVFVGGMPYELRPRPWHGFDRACRAASYHERLWLAARRNKAQAGQGGE